MQFLIARKKHVFCFFFIYFLSLFLISLAAHLHLNVQRILLESHVYFFHFSFVLILISHFVQQISLISLIHIQSTLLQILILCFFMLSLFLNFSQTLTHKH